MNNTEYINILLKFRHRAAWYETEYLDILDKKLHILIKEHYRLYHGHLRCDGCIIDKDDEVKLTPKVPPWMLSTKKE